ncbi:MAG: glycosyltransferase family 2 protein [Flexilinea sp.]|nr:glycosyltransferase family 2 protein [Flexilinea sp.]
MELVSVIVPVYNVDAYLEKCVHSITNQTYQKLEIILVNDGSTDQSAEICKRLAEQDNRINFISQKNKGQSAARNNGLRTATGEYIAFIDGDDFWDHDMLEYLIALLKEDDSQISVCGVRHIGFPDVEDPEINDGQRKSYSGIEAAKHTLLGANGFSGSACHALFQRDPIMNDEFFLEGHIFEDLEYMVRLMLKADKVSVSRLRKYNYCYRPDNSSSKSTRKRKEDLDAVIEQLKTLIKEKQPSLMPMVEQRYISNGIHLIRSLHEGEDYLFEELRKSIIQYEPQRKMLSKSDWILANALKSGKNTFLLMNSFYQIFREAKKTYAKRLTRIR